MVAHAPKKEIDIAAHTDRAVRNDDHLLLCRFHDLTEFIFSARAFGFAQATPSGVKLEEGETDELLFTWNDLHGSNYTIRRVITFAEYMNRMLYGPAGYYSTGTAKSGKTGDYFTA